MCTQTVQQVAFCPRDNIWQLRHLYSAWPTKQANSSSPLSQLRDHSFWRKKGKTLSIAQATLFDPFVSVEQTSYSLVMVYIHTCPYTDMVPPSTIHTTIPNEVLSQDYIQNTLKCSIPVGCLVKPAPVDSEPLSGPWSRSAGALKPPYPF